MIDLSKIEKRLIVSSRDFENWMEGILTYIGEPIGFDIETNGEDFPKTELAGFSLFSRRLSKVCYVSINHVGKCCLFLDEIKENLQRIFNKSIMVTHGGAYDFLLMNKLGFKFYNAIDSYLLAVALQFQNLGLKDLVLEFGLVRFGEVITYKKLMSKLGFPEDWIDFTKVNIFQSKDAFNYAVNDSIFAFHLAEILYNRYIEFVGSQTAADNIKAQTDTMLMLCESSAKGHYMDRKYLNNFIYQYGGELNNLETKLMFQVKKKMGWV